MKIVRAQIELNIICKDAKTDDEAKREAENYGLPPEYVNDSFEILEVH